MSKNLWWSIPLELLLLTFSFIGLISSLIFILIVITRYEFRQNLALLLAMNLSFGGLITCISMISQGIYMMMNSPEDRLCPYRSYFFTVGGLYIFEAAALQTLHRLIVIIFVHRRHWQNRCLFFFLALIQLILCLLGLLPLLLTNRFPYYPSANACYIALNDIFGVLYPACWTYFFVFFFATILSNDQWQAPSYALHLSFMGSSAATGSSMLANLILTKPVKKILLSFLPKHPR
ncbi:unnamed protein product [Adineta steineri]|uniref:G-protein coupled receptors family 1 profile domain-containing protein n=1 Tax=Adineta steineri TaxID=433720 RepID=A0A819NN17_9BILA|nr:unnamed protein product [Adineta steineri]CAF3998729.1 unnamed protein product [Adineta steineri]